MTLYYYMYRNWQDCCRRGENRSWPSVSVESVDSEYWCLNNTIVYAFIMRLTVEEHVLWSTFKLNTLYKICLMIALFLPGLRYVFEKRLLSSKGDRFITNDSDSSPRIPTVSSVQRHMCRYVRDH